MKIDLAQRAPSGGRIILLSLRSVYAAFSAVSPASGSPLEELRSPAWWAVPLLAFAILLSFAPGLHAPFLLDDRSSIQRNTSIRHLWPPEAAVVGGTRGRPLANYSFALNYAAGGTAVLGYHVGNVALHIASAVVLFGLVRRTLLLPSVAVGESQAAGTALLSATTWALHPLQTEAVTYLSQRTELLMGLCYLLTLYCFVRSAGPSAATRAWSWLAIAICCAGMACKEVMGTAPLAVLLFDRTFVSGSFRQALRSRVVVYAGLASTWLLLAGLMIGIGDRGVGLSHGIDSWSYLRIESRAILGYLRLVLWPSPLVFDYGEAKALLPATAGYAILLLVLFLAVLGLFVRRPKIGVLALWPFLLLAPSSSVIPVALQPVAEHRMYLPLASLAVAASLLLIQCARRHAWIAAAPLLALLALATFDRNGVYRDAVSLWTDTVRKAPTNTRARENLGAALLAANQLAAAEQALRETLAAAPDDAAALIDYAELEHRRGHREAALRLAEQAADADPRSADARFTAGCILAELGRPRDAVAVFRDAVRLAPTSTAAHNNLANLLSQAGDHQGAVEHYTLAHAGEPRDPEILYNRGGEYLYLGRADAALRDYREALVLRPKFDAARYQLDRLTRILGDQKR